MAALPFAPVGVMLALIVTGSTFSPGQRPSTYY